MMTNPAQLCTDRDSVRLEHGEVRVIIDPDGASLVHLSVQDVSVVPQVSSPDARGRYVGSVIAPWPNRIADGRYTFHGDVYQLACNETERNNALHGFTADQKWQILTATPTETTLSTVTGGVEGYPWQVALLVTYRVERDGVSIRLTAANISDSTAPFGAAFHPYVQFPDSPPAQWTLTMAAQYVVVPDNDRLLPVEEVHVGGSGLDFRDGASIDGDFVDHAFGQFPGAVAAKLSDSNGRIIWLEACQRSPWIQLHKPVNGPLIGSVVLEPQTCPPNAFSSGRDVIELRPEETVVMSWTIRVFPGGERA